MKIMYVLPISWGGIPHYTAELANAISKHYSVTVLKPKDGNDKLFNSRIQLIHIFSPMYFSYKNLYKSIFSFNIFRNLVCIKDFGKIVDDVDPDIIHFPELYPQSVFMIYISKIFRKYPIAATLHSTFSSIWSAFLKTIALKNSLYGIIAGFVDCAKFFVPVDRYIVHSDYNKHSLLIRGVPSEKISVIPHGSYSLFNTSNRYKVDKEEGMYYVLYFGYIKKNKGTEYLIKSAPIINKYIKNFKIIIAGEGNLPNCSELMDFNIKKKIKIINRYISNEEIPELFQQADVVVLPYIYHLGHSGVLTIALSFGKPIVVTNVGDFPNLIKNGKEGFVVPPKDPKALADAIIKILEDDKLKKKASRNALKKAEALSWDKIAKMHAKVYEDILERWSL